MAVTLEQLFLAQPLNPLRRLKFTAMPKFPVITPTAGGGSVSVRAEISRPEVEDRQTMIRDSVCASYARLDEVIE